MATKLYGIGVGPGDSELLTLKALRILKECDIIAVPEAKKNSNYLAYSIAKGAYPEIDKKEIVKIPMPMSRDTQVLRNYHEKAADTIIHFLDEGKNVAFLTLGDPSIYSTYMYIHNIVKEKNHLAEIIPGISSFSAAAASLGISLAEGKDAIHIIPASYKGTREALMLPGTKVLMKTGKSFKEVKSYLQEMDLLKKSKMVQNCTMDNEKIYEDITKADPEYFSVIVVKEN